MIVYKYQFLVVQINQSQLVNRRAFCINDRTVLISFSRSHEVRQFTSKVRSTHIQFSHSRFALQKLISRALSHSPIHQQLQSGFSHQQYPCFSTLRKNPVPVFLSYQNLQFFLEKELSDEGDGCQLFQVVQGELSGPIMLRGQTITIDSIERIGPIITYQFAAVMQQTKSSHDEQQVHDFPHH